MPSDSLARLQHCQSVNLGLPHWMMPGE